MPSLELVLVAFFLATWVVDFLALVGIVGLAGNLELGLYPLYSVSAAIGWLSGNIYVPRSRLLPRSLRRRVLLVYFVGPLGPVYLLRAMASVQTQMQAPFVPLYAAGVFTVFFLVPVLIQGPNRRSLRIGKRESEAKPEADGDPPVLP